MIYCNVSFHYLSKGRGLANAEHVIIYKSAKLVCVSSNGLFRMIYWPCIKRGQDNQSITVVPIRRLTTDDIMKFPVTARKIALIFKPVFYFHFWKLVKFPVEIFQIKIYIDMTSTICYKKRNVCFQKNSSSKTNYWSCTIN